MSAKPSSDLDPLDLALRARTSSLASDEELSLDRALATSASLRIAHQVGHELDFACRVRARDQALIARALDGALTRTTRPLARRTTRVAFVLAATLVVASGAAATHAVVERFVSAPTAGIPDTPAPAAQRTEEPTGRLPVHNSAPGAEPGPSAAKESAPALSTENEATPSPAPATRPGAAAHAAASEASVELTAGALFREAGAARRAGDVAKARGLYLELASRFPTSNEATVSHVSLGSLLLSAGEPGAAEKAFSRYLRSGQRSLREEALAGRADALRALGRTDDERRAREDLLRLDPGGVYASRARRRIAEIDEARRRASP
jgi:TolA-binding protein